jgi:hypothetical protein
MRLLEDDVETLSQLDEYRVESANRRDEGRRALAASFSEKEEWWEDDEKKVGTLQKALAVRALLTHTPERYEALASGLADELTKLTIYAAFDPEPDKMPFLRATRAMHALVNAPGPTRFRTIMWFYYRIVRELYSAHPPEWVTGGTRAAEEAGTTAYVTGESVRAVLGLHRAMQRNALYVGALAELNEEWTSLQEIKEIPDAWLEIEAPRLAREFFTTLETQKGNIGLRPARPVSARQPVTFSGQLITELATVRHQDIRDQIDAAVEAFREAKSDIEDYRKDEFRNMKDALVRQQRSETPHLIAFGAIERAIKNAERARDEYAQHPNDPTGWLKALAEIFMDAARETKRVLQPAIGYLSRVLDRELAAAASNDKVSCDLPELAFAAASYGACDGHWQDERLRRAAEVLTEKMSERGRFPLGRPLHATADGYKAHVIGSEVIRAFSQILENVKAVPVEPRTVKCMMTYFLDTEVKQREGVWAHDEPQHSDKPHRWSTAFAVLALDRLNRMLDERINCRVLSYFHYRMPSGPGLEDLFYSDYGLARHKRESKESVAVMLERVRAHVRGLPREYDREESLYSIILHGPAGTGKTTLVEALAKSCDVPLVEVTPSDIVIGGLDAVERRARAVFMALSLLTRAVIMFDEFDPVLRQREDNPKGGPSSVFSFLTPGMLPKLKTLHDAARKRSTAYILITNLIGTLDRAAIREGRFDLAVGIYPPDLLSRVGRFYSVLRRYELSVRKAEEAAEKEREKAEAEGKAVVGGPPDATPSLHAAGEEAKQRREEAVRKRAEVEQVQPARITELIHGTANVSMNTLGKRGWYVAPRRQADLKEDTPFAYVTSTERKGYQCRPMEAPEQHGTSDEAEREYQEWKWVAEWDALAAEATSIEEALRNPPGKRRNPQRTRRGARQEERTA